MKSALLTILSFLSIVSNALAVNLSDYRPYKYEVLFTNPLCATYFYNEPVETNGGDFVTKKPKNAYCTGYDKKASGERDSSPQKRMIDWIKDPETKEIFFTFLSISNRTVMDALCNEIKYRNLKVVFYMDSQNESSLAEDLVRDCQPRQESVAPGEEPNYPRYYTKGHIGSYPDQIGWSHNKLFVANPYDKNKVRLAFGSGNLSSGVILHHENWSFVTTNPKSYFYQSHLCLMNGMRYATDAKDYSKQVNDCQAGITTEKEEDIDIFLIPGDGYEAVKAAKDQIYSSKNIYAAAHRFRLFSWDLANAARNGANVKLVLDDDTYWAGLGQEVGPNQYDEYENAEDVRLAGGSVRYMETNHGEHKLHHNKFMVFDSAVLTGAANFTSTGYGVSDDYPNNYENIYMIRIPEVVKAYKDQHDHLYNTLATSWFDLPIKDLPAYRK